MSKLALMNIRHRLVQASEQSQALLRYPRRDQSAISRIAVARDEAQTLETVQQPRHVRNLGHEPIPNVGAAKSFRSRASKYSEHVVLGAGNGVRLQRLREIVAEHRGSALEAQLSLLLQASEAFPLFDLILQLSGHPRNMCVITRIVNNLADDISLLGA